MFGYQGVDDTEVDVSIQRACMALSKGGGFGYNRFHIIPITISPLSE